MTKLRTIIVDDEADSRNTLRSYTGKYCPDIQVVTECANIIEAKTAILEYNPDLVFLDIEMPFGNAFDLLEQLDEIDFELIFVTAFSQYAMQALNMSAVHYLLKPVSIEELIQAVEKVKERRSRQREVNHAKILLENISGIQSQHQKVVLPLMDGFEVVKMGEIMYCEAQDNFTCFYLKDGKKALICRKLKYYEAMLSDYGFCRIHRSTMINLDYVKRYIKGKGGSVILENGTELQVANARKGDFLERFG